jgi:hypothetical protein
MTVHDWFFLTPEGYCFAVSVVLGIESRASMPGKHYTTEVHPSAPETIFYLLDIYQRRKIWEEFFSVPGHLFI